MEGNNKTRRLLMSVLLGFFSIGTMLAFVSASAQALPDWPLMPYPASVEPGKGEIEVRSSMSLAITGEGSETLPPGALSTGSLSTGALPSGIVERFAKRFQQQTGVAVERNGSGEGLGLNIHVEQASPDLQNLSEPLKPHWESYQLHITEEGIYVHALTQLGVQHALETLLQLAGSDASGQVRFPIACIMDHPRFSWRGLMLDSVRHFFSVETIKRQLDGMAAAKLNVFHWHLTDDQGWRLESKAYPRLQEVASQGQFYTREQVRDVVEYAAERGIQVMPEIDMPGHSSAIAVAYPELMSAPGPYNPEDRWGVHRPLLNPANEQVYEFAEAILTEVAELFPFGYVHIGGDEVDPHDWLENDTIQAFMKTHGLEDSQALHAYFNQRLADILTGLDRNMMGWDEVLHPDLPQGAAVQSWRGPDALGQAAKQGHPAILSTGFYLDQPQTAGYHYRNRFFPESVSLNDSLLAGETAQAWSFEFTRKRGSAIRGVLTLIEGAANQRRGFVDFDGKSRQTLEGLELNGSAVRFKLDTWMGPVRARLTREQEALTGELIVGNASYPVSGQLTASSSKTTAQWPASMNRSELSESERELILGGEIALWSELIDEQSIDLRLWPRAFVVAERLWSPADLNDVDFLYQRLPAVSQWAEGSVGLMHKHQQNAALSRMVPEVLLTDVKTLSEALEPAQYYHRHHEKSVHETYSRRDPLNRFVDSLPAESLPLRNFSQQVEQWLGEPGNDALAQSVENTLAEWRDAARVVLKQVSQNDNDELHKLAEQVHSTAEWGLVLAYHWQTYESLAPAVREAASRSLRRARSIHGEVVVSLAYPLESLLEKVPVAPVTRDWMPEQSFTNGIEGPAIGPDGALYAVNFNRQGTLGRISAQNRGEIFVNLPEGSVGNSIRFDASGHMWVADYTGHNLLKLDAHTGELLATYHNNAMHQPNDLAMTRGGQIFATDPDWNNTGGQLWRMDPDGEFTLLETGMGTTNGIELSPDERLLYVNESVQRRVWVYDLSEAGELSNKRLFYQFDDGGLDGMASDSAGNLYIARYGSGVILVLSPEGRVLERIQLRGRYPTNITLDLGEEPRAFVTMQQRGAIEVFSLPLSPGR